MLTIFLYGMLGAATAVAAMLFLRLWQKTRDRLFLYFAAAFAVLSIERAFLATIDPGNEFAPYVYVARLLAYGLIIAAIVDKNREH
jgi:hypothetical protein